ncbi:TetR/AcrR family transcriptional regulator [Nonomuraea gerenzanensis]|uniref:Transcriptional regulator, TetR family n=1 Tax=Nonomuraea gerenzanensis TaxID=93944 RepID=A0A1M4ENV7_9ACTN|nr:TetR/AcrR family transcriptional regulator [Nonomuraea gerenzanensis]UBU12016.1 TetR/AcrR family transcriptional regulator [Nonomuraea gerenzanensis]SBP00531.1 Transcriptional regulator, TetR family [Nonomuraea gerenzanensis]
MTTAPPLRERKKLRTRQALIDTALDLFGTRGYGAVTLDELCEEVEVSKRTFFRYFGGKEDVAMAPLHDMWRAFLEELETIPADGRPLMELMEATLLAALDRVADEAWAGRAALSHRLSRETSSMDAHNLHFCESTLGAVLEVLHRRLDLPDDPRTRLAGDMLVAAWRVAVGGWAATAGERPSVPALAARFHEAVAALPGSLTLTATPRAEPR